MSVQRQQSGLIVLDNGTRIEDQIRGYCRVCAAGFTQREMRPGGEYEGHVAKCFSENEQKIEEQRKRERGFFDAGDREAEDWTQEHAGEIIEGRKSDVYGSKRRRA
jgi:hypothetical protein